MAKTELKATSGAAIDDDKHYNVELKRTVEVNPRLVLRPNNPVTLSGSAYRMLAGKSENDGAFGDVTEVQIPKAETNVKK